MTQEQKQFIIKALQTGIPAIAREHIDALEEVVSVEQAKSEDLNGQEEWKFLNQLIHNNIVETLRSSFPLMADEYIGAYCLAVNAGQAKFMQNANARAEREKSAAEMEKVVETPASKKKQSKQIGE